MLLGRGRGRRDVLPSNIAGGQYSAVGSDHSHAVAGVVDAGYDVVAVLCFRLSLILYFYSVDGQL